MKIGDFIEEEVVIPLDPLAVVEQLLESDADVDERGFEPPDPVLAS